MRRRKARLIVLGALLSLVLVFAVQNVAMVEVQFLLWGFRMPRSVLIFGVLAVGVLTGWVLKGASRRARA